MIRVDMSEVDAFGVLMGAEVADVVRRVLPVVGEAQQDVMAGAQSMVPVGATGRLKGSIRPTGQRLRRRVRAGGGKAFYGRFQEFGTRKMSAHPFLVVQANAANQARFEGHVNSALRGGPLNL